MRGLRGRWNAVLLSTLNLKMGGLGLPGLLNPLMAEKTRERRHPRPFVKTKNTLFVIPPRPPTSCSGW
ncbi:hypothetical protein IEQ34_024858 [Dendrobium chrysotoxum]|uniref:Uncharacterized protein n=1 Tax=Dendrobium chrysotoxum TaxID=161865 RepID=A0AAV7FRF4_DENCH|nr:hypothetical protein IEQ34_024858 [Dendrobium chrysotoxum]